MCAGGRARPSPCRESTSERDRESTLFLEIRSLSKYTIYIYTLLGTLLRVVVNDEINRVWCRCVYPGVLAAKVRDFGSNPLKCPRGQMGTKRAKVGHLAPGAI